MDAVLERLRAELAGRYEVEQELGRGGMAVVYLARDLRHDRRVAIMQGVDLGAIVVIVTTWQSRASSDPVN